jgi:dihydroorotate dehydrogenase
MYRLLLKPIFFRFSPEYAHWLTMRLFAIAVKTPLLGALMRRFFCVEDARLHKTVMGLHFPNVVGLAAGFDKNGDYFPLMQSLGFGFVELGTVTPKPQAGNDAPRLFRLPHSEALINRMGFNNDGVDALVQKILDWTSKNPSARQKIILGGNIGKNKITPNDAATADYEYCFEKLFSSVDYFVVNVSSPNTPDLRALQDKAPLTELLTRLQSLNHAHAMPKPMLLKIAPDVSDTQLDDIIDIIKQTQLTGVIATNTTIRRDGLQGETHAHESGGLSGKPLQQRATEVVRYLRQGLGKSVVIIGVGGIESAAAAQEKLDAGADLIQIYTGLVYEGPTLVRRILKSFLRH